MIKVIKSKKGISMAMIVELMIILFAMFTTMSTFIVMQAITTKGKEKTLNTTSYSKQISAVFEDKYNGYLREYTKSGRYETDVKILDNSNSDFLEFYKDNGYTIKTEKTEENVSSYYSLWNNELKYEIVVEIDYVKLTSKVIFKKTLSTTIYFTEILKLDVVGPKYDIVDWKIRM